MKQLESKDWFSSTIIRILKKKLYFVSKPNAIDKYLRASLFIFVSYYFAIVIEAYVMIPISFYAFLYLKFYKAELVFKKGNNFADYSISRLGFTRKRKVYLEHAELLLIMHRGYKTFGESLVLLEPNRKNFLGYSSWNLDTQIVTNLAHLLQVDYSVRRARWIENE